MAKATNGKRGGVAPASDRMLPGIDFTHDDNAANADKAIAALDVASQLEEPAEPSGQNVQQTSQGAGDPGASPSAESAQPPATTPAPAKAQKPESATPAPKDAGPKLEKLTSKKYNGVKADVLRVQLIERDNEVTQLRHQLEAKTVAAVALNPDAAKSLSLACGETLGLVSSLAARKWGPECKLTPPQRTRLGDVWAPVVAPWLQSSEHAQLIQAIMATADVMMDRIDAVAAARAEAKVPA